jgi:hypothetical protein
MRAWLVALALIACKPKAKPAPTCDGVAAKAAAAPLVARPKILIEGCQPCGEWTPMLGWNVEASAGGPKREQIEQLMVRCDAFCTGSAKTEFMGALDKARGSSSNRPWRELGKSCKDKVSAAGDDRFVSAPYFALDRIARKIGGNLEVPLPPVTVSGAGIELPRVAPARVLAYEGRQHVTLVADTIYVGTLPRAKLTANGLELDLGTPPYPGVEVPIDQLAAKLTGPVLVLAPRELAARKLAPILAAGSSVQLGVWAPESPEGWQLPGAIALPPAVANTITEGMTVQQLAVLVTK